MLHDRATRDLQALYLGAEDGNPPGDGDMIRSMVRNHGVRHKDAFRDCWTFFIDLGDMPSPQGGSIGRYGSSTHIKRDSAEILTALDAFVKSNLIIPQRVGELVITRQMMLAQSLLILIDDILNVANPATQPHPPAGRKKNRGNKNAANPTAAPTTSATPAPSLQDLTTAVDDRAAAYRDFNGLLRTEPQVLAHELNIHFYSRPDLLPDELGRTLPAHTDRYIPGAFVDVIKGAARSEAVWRHLARLLRLLDTADKSNRGTVAQLITNICHDEYTAAQAWLGRQLSISNTLRAAFRRTARPNDAGRYKGVLRKDAESLTDFSVCDRYLLRLSKPTTLCRQAGPLIAALDDLSAADVLDEGIADALSDLAEIVWLVQGLASTASLPAFTRHRCQEVSSSLATVDADLDALRATLDIADFIPSVNVPLKSAGLHGALDRLDAHVAREGGDDIAARYDAAITCALEPLESALRSPVIPQKSATPDSGENVTPEVPASKKPKQKTRPPQSLPSPDSEPSTSMVTSAPACILPSSPATVVTMTTVLCRSESSRVLSWSNFESAMADVGFSITPRGGSVYTYAPPAVLAEHGPLTLHRPHTAKLEGYRLLHLAHRLHAKYGWTSDSFAVRR